MNVFISPGNRNDVARLVREKLGENVRVLHQADGSPILAGSNLNVSISHSHHFVALAVHPSLRIGIDIEEPRMEQLRRVIAKFLSEKEVPLWDDRLLAAWTCKEAVFKAAGVQGLGFGQIDITEPGYASIPDGRKFALQTIETPSFTLTLATPCSNL